MEKIVTVTAQCPKCKKKKYYEMPITFTPFCGKCIGIPMIVKKVTVQTVK
jgi:endogenous inhibitor of DNA gyrase (YacG/DUF329 family)